MPWVICYIIAKKMLSRSGEKENNLQKAPEKETGDE